MDAHTTEFIDELFTDLVALEGEVERLRTALEEIREVTNDPRLVALADMALDPEPSRRPLLRLV